MKMGLWGRGSLAILLVFLVSCGTSGKASHADADLPLVRVDEATASAISGKVIFAGDPPVMRTIDMSSNPSCERQHHTPQKSEQVVVNSNGTLRYVFVWIEDGLPKGRWPVPTAAAKLDQDGCMYRPHVMGVMTGQQVEIDNSDPVNHNVHAEAAVNQAWNESQPPRAEKKFKQFDLQEVMFPVTCSVHPWMRSYIAVVSHPFFAVTGEDGAFALRGVPPGVYTLEAVHERYGRKQARVAVGPKQTQNVDFTFLGT